MSSSLGLVGRLERDIAQLSDRRACVLVGHANTAIHLVLRAIEERCGTGEVILPAITCPTVAQTVIYAGFTPVFADVTLPECTIDVDAVRKLISERTRAIVPTHIFGRAAPMRSVLAVAKERDIAVIEDVAQATGGHDDGTPFGALGDFAVHSFTEGKIIVAGGGGALLTDDIEAASRIRKMAAALPALAPDFKLELQALSQRNLQHALVDMLRVAPDISVAATFRQMLPHYRQLSLHSVVEESPCLPRIEAGLGRLQENLKHRLALAQRYHHGLAGLDEALELAHDPIRSGVVWRYTLFLRDPQAVIAMTNELRANRLLASNHYWSVAQLVNDEQLPAATYASRRLLNLWVDESTDTEAADAAIGVIRARLAG